MVDWCKKATYLSTLASNSLWPAHCSVQGVGSCEAYMLECELECVFLWSVPAWMCFRICAWMWSLVKHACSYLCCMPSRWRLLHKVRMRPVAFARVIAINIHRIRVAMQCNKHCVLFNEETTVWSSTKPLKVVILFFVHLAPSYRTRYPLSLPIWTNAISLSNNSASFNEKMGPVEKLSENDGLWCRSDKEAGYVTDPLALEGRRSHSWNSTVGTW